MAHTIHLNHQNILKTQGFQCSSWRKESKQFLSSRIIAARFVHNDTCFVFSILEDGIAIQTCQNKKKSCMFIDQRISCED